MTVQQIIDTVMDFSVPPEQRRKQTCDKLMAGETEATGMATTFMATADVIREAAKMGANLIITHEPTWWSGTDDTDWLEGGPVYKEKRILWKKIALWRYHDHMHNPGPIYSSLLKELGWE